jgi:Thioesterase domain/Phosphopantetheine attachment site
MNDPSAGELAGTGYRCPRDPVEIWLARQWQNVLGFATGIGENFFGVGGNSLDAARVIDAILAEFGIQLPLNVLAEYPTVELLAAVLREHGGRLGGPVVVIQDGDGTRPVLFLVHPDSGQAGPYCGLARELGEEFAVAAIEAAGLYPGAEPRRSVPAMAGAYAAAVRAACPAGPYLLGGCAVGAAVAYEMAARLDDVRLVAVIGAGLLDAGDGSWPGEPLPPDAAPESAARSVRVRQASQDAMRDWRPSPYAGPVDVFGQPPVMALPAAVVQRAHECGTGSQLAGALRELIG